MKISWYGHSCFRIKCKEIDLVIDPYGESTGLKLSKTKADVVLTTHSHDDHNNINAISGDPFVIDGPGEYEVKGVFVYGKHVFHDNKNGEEGGLVTMYLIEEDGVKIAHLGDIGQKQLTDEQLEFLDDVDIVLVPVGGRDTLNAQGAAELISQIEPRVVVPMHYKIPGLKMDIDGVDNFIKETNLTPETVDEFKATSDNLPSDNLKLVIFNKQ